MTILNADSLHESKDRDGESILSWMSALINAHVDVAKDPYILRLNVNKYTYQCFSQRNIKDIHDYIHDPMTATKINRLNSGPRRSRVITTELIYYWMTANNIPFECEKWHFNRLITLIQVCGIENNPNKKKMGRQAILRQNAELNAARKAKYHTKG